MAKVITTITYNTQTKEMGLEIKTDIPITLDSVTMKGILEEAKVLVDRKRQDLIAVPKIKLPSNIGIG